MNNGALILTKPVDHYTILGFTLMGQKAPGGFLACGIIYFSF